VVIWTYTSALFNSEAKWRIWTKFEEFVCSTNNSLQLIKGGSGYWSHLVCTTKWANCNIQKSPTNFAVFILVFVLNSAKLYTTVVITTAQYSKSSGDTHCNFDLYYLVIKSQSEDVRIMRQQWRPPGDCQQYLVQRVWQVCAHKRPAPNVWLLNTAHFCLNVPLIWYGRP